MEDIILILLLALAPFLVLAMWRKVYPGRRLVFVSTIPVGATLLLYLNEALTPLVWGTDLVITFLALIDLFAIPPSKHFAVERSCGRVASLSKDHRVELSISNAAKYPYRVRIRDGAPQEFETRRNNFELTLAPRSRSHVHYDFRATRRGAFEFEAVFLELRSMLGLWVRHVERPCVTTINVYPDMKQLSEYALLAKTNRLNLVGVRRTRRIGQDNEFERLRDYTLDDSFKNIDWRSTARRNKLTVKDFQTNQSQRVIFMLDCGRMMTNEAKGISLLDHSLNAMLMLSYVALQKGDAVGLITFSDRVHSSVPARGGQGQMNHLLHAVYDRFPKLVESRYEDAFLHLSKRCRKRSLVVLFTNVIDEVNARQIYRYLSLFKGRHLPLAIVLRDHQLFQAAELDEATPGHRYRAAAAADILCWRNQVLTDLQHRGVMVMDSYPEAMTAPLINAYLDIKARHLL